MPDLTDEEKKLVYARLAELGLDVVKAVAAADGFPTPQRLLVLQWIARGGKEPPAEKPKEK